MNDRSKSNLVFYKSPRSTQLLSLFESQKLIRFTISSIRDNLSKYSNRCHGWSWNFQPLSPLVFFHISFFLRSKTMWWSRTLSTYVFYLFHVLKYFFFSKKKVNFRFEDWKFWKKFVFIFFLVWNGICVAIIKLLHTNLFLIINDARISVTMRCTES